jgi:hypothetical protein
MIEDIKRALRYSKSETEEERERREKRIDILKEASSEIRILDDKNNYNVDSVMFPKKPYEV